MGKLTDALKKAAEERVERIDKISRVRRRDKIVAHKMGNSKVSSNLVTYFDSKALITEQYKILRTNFLAMNKGKPPKMVVVTSALHSEGKTVTTLNLAIALAQSVRKPRILVIDADMRRGRVHRYLGIDQKAGLSEVLQGQNKLEDVLFQIDIENLTFMTAGNVPDNPSELLSSDEMRNLLDDVKSEYDHVLIDSPPIISVTDAGTIGHLTDGVLMCVQAGRTQRGVLKRAIELLNQSRTNVLGYVLTNIEYHLPEYIYRYL